eukprot:Plantae.Rhodophyta-Rhodochaete_pulchella.ctg2358.p2 GENE.Plantae.Rhodophyta-Rhodochaete_pulchella.ctg2358~~Plantae.Rhodophyta-Rhodochaete_pulchella.ctg2358.p2  ORF type:complete len:216 (-),score=38.91 Plantae.Rhodophyta-Rhodochaete_pulchella.ctg2358:760-1407(-)
MQAGLGGGSGNAATALWAANKLCDAGLSNEELADLGALFGSDISFFFSKGTAYCTGRGEILTEVDPLPPMSLYIVKPPEGLSTKLVFQTLDLTTLSNEDPEALIPKIRSGAYWATYVNDLETPSFKLLPKLEEIKHALITYGFRVVLMSGSGTSFFCLGEPATQEVENFKEDFEKEYGVSIWRCQYVRRWTDDRWYLEPHPEPLRPLKHTPDLLG